MRFAYPVDLVTVKDGPPEDHCVLLTFPDLPEANTFGKTEAEALASAVDCLEVALAGRIKDRADVPEPSPADGRPTVIPGNLIAAKAGLYVAMRQDGVRPAELARRLGVEQPAINRLLDPYHASKPERLDAAFAKLGRRLVLSVERAA
ncbi:MAG: type II toxin-antitoxin system HicB family antitoxin [Rhodospirillales bacterium]